MHKKAFLKYLQFEKRYSSHTICSYETDLEQFGIFCNSVIKDFDITKADHRIIRSWIVHLTENNISARTIRRKLTTLRSFYRYLNREGLLSNNPAEKIIPPKLSKRLPVFVDEDSINTLIDNYEFGDDFSGVRNRLIMEMFYTTGVRLSELINLKNIDIDHYNMTIKVLGKRNKERIVPYNASLNKTIKEYVEKKKEISQEDGMDFFFITDKGNKIYNKFVYRIVNKYLQLVTTIEKKSPHVLRHTFATHMLNSGADINAIKELLGHANLSATQVYTHNTFEKLKNIYKQAHPRA